MHKSASDGLTMHRRAPKISKFSWGGMPPVPLQKNGLTPTLTTKGAPLVQFAQGLLNPLGGPASNPFPRFLLPMTSHVERPSCLKKCQTLLDSSLGTVTTVVAFDIAIELQGLFTCTCATRILAVASYRERRSLFCSARSEVR